MRGKVWWVGICCAVLLSACGKPGSTPLAKLQAPGNLDAIQSRGELVIVTRNAPTVYYIDRDGRASGPEHDLATAFARYLDVTPRFVVLDSVGAMLKAVADGKADMAAGSISLTRARSRQFTFGPVYAKVWQEVVCNHNSKPRNVAQLATRVNKLVVSANTSYVERLEKLSKQHPGYGLEWKAATDIGTEALLRKVAQEKIDCTIADSNIVDINRRYYPNLLMMFKIGPAQHLAWPMPKAAGKLRTAARKWLAAYRKSGKLAALERQYYGFVGKWNYVDKHTLVKKIKTVYPRFEDYFAAAARKYDFDKWLLAAQAYQESHWNPKATSHTGVRGIMMLTKNTARAMGVKNRLDPKQSIMGGAAYLRRIEKRLPDNIAPPDRYYFTLAAYNIGYFHLRDAMKLAKRHGLNPSRWVSMKKMLPKLMRKKYYRHLKYGYARGVGALRYVQRIRDYGDIIHHFSK